MGIMRRRPKIKSFEVSILTFSILMISLQSYYWESLGFAVFPVIGALALLIVGLKKASTRNLTSIEAGFMAFVFFYFLYEILVNLFFRYSASLNDFLSPIIVLVSVFGLLQIMKNKRGVNALLAALRIVLLIHATFFFVQAIYWALTGSFIDFLQPLTGEAQRVFSSKGMVIAGRTIPRFSGLFNEPGTYAVTIFTLFGLYFSHLKRIDLTIVLSLATVLLTLSAFGFIISTGFILIVIMRGASIQLRAGGLGLLALAVFFFAPDMIRRFTTISAGFDGRLEFLVQAVDINNWLFGVKDLSVLPIAHNDAGFALYILLTGGIIKLFLFFIVCYIALRDHGSLVPLIFILVTLTKLKLSYPLPWLFLASFVSVNSRRYISSAKTNKRNTQTVFTGSKHRDQRSPALQSRKSTNLEGHRA